MELVKQEDMNKIAPLFEGWEETLIWSCLQGCMGTAWADQLEHPASAQIITGDFCFFAGLPNTELLRNIPAEFTNGILMISKDDKWSFYIEQEFGAAAYKTKRYAIKKEAGVFDRQKLQSNIANLPNGYRLQMIDKALYDLLLTEDWSIDLCSQFPEYSDYETHGLGVAALYEDIPVSGASSYTFYKEGIEIEIDTKSQYRRKGLALACASKLILECLDRGLYPSWDAQNMGSVALAEKLGYHFDKEYVTYEVTI